MYGTQQQFGQQFGAIGQPHQELVKVLGQTVWNLRELENRIVVLKQECGVLCTTLGIPPNVVGLTFPGTFGGVGSWGGVGPWGGAGSWGVPTPWHQGFAPWQGTTPWQGLSSWQGFAPWQGFSPWQGSYFGITPGVGGTFGGVSPYLGTGISPYTTPYVSPYMGIPYGGSWTGVNPLLHTGWFY